MCIIDLVLSILDEKSRSMFIRDDSIVGNVRYIGKDIDMENPIYVLYHNIIRTIAELKLFSTINAMKVLLKEKFNNNKNFLLLRTKLKIIKSILIKTRYNPNKSKPLTQRELEIIYKTLEKV